MHIGKTSRSAAGFTLMELMVVVVIVGVLAGIAIPTYTATREKAYDREAVTSLRLVRVALKQYYGKYGCYYPPTSTITTPTINSMLNLDLNANLWAYQIASSGFGSSYSATAQRSGRTWTMNPGVTDPTCSGSCL